MIRLVACLAPAALAVVGLWSWLGAAVPMPPSPLPASGQLPCVSYAPFREGQSPLDGGTPIAPQQIDEDFARLSRLTECVRTYSTELGLDAVPQLAAKHGLSVLQGIWLGRNPKTNAIEIESAIALAKAHPQTVRGLIVGNEVLLRGEMSPTDLADTLREVKHRVEVPVTYADVWEFWVRHRDLAGAVDFVTVHILPYWEDEPVSATAAAAHIDVIRQKVGAAFPDKDILIGETGWPSAGRMREGARPSPAAQAQVMHALVAVARDKGYRLNVIEAFDQPWKRRLEGTVGGHWGLLDAGTRAFKFAWGQPVSNHPLWPWQAAGGVALMFAMGLAAWLAGRGRSLSGAAMAGLAASAVAAGVGVPWAAEALALESLGWGGWLRNGALFAAALMAAPLAAAAMARRRPVAAFPALLDPARRVGHDPLGLAIGALLLAVTVLALVGAFGLVFDPRYKDFPFPALTAAVVPLAAAVAVMRPRGPGEGVAEIFAAAVLAGSAVFIVLNETVANWQALWTAALWLVLALSLLRVRGVTAGRS